MFSVAGDLRVYMDGGASTSASENCVRDPPEEGASAILESVDQLSKGLIAIYLEDLDAVAKQLTEFKRDQNVLIDTLNQENAKFSTTHDELNLKELIENVTVYQAKLTNIKKGIATLHEKAAKLKMMAVTTTLSTKKRSQLSLCDKLQILADVDSKVDRRDICAKFKCGKSTISSIISNRSKLAAAAENSAKDRKRQRRNKFPELDAALYRWLKFQQDSNMPINGPILLDTANVLANAMNISKETGEIKSGWIDRFKARHGITFKDSSVETPPVVEMTSPDNWLQNTWPFVCCSYEPDRIYNADECGIFYKMLPENALTLRGERCTEGEMSNERVTVLICSNATGTDRRRLLLIGKYKKPTCFKNINIMNLPVDYTANKDAWMTADIFTNWLREWNKELQKKDRKILLLIDNCSAHPFVRKLSNIKLVYIPANATSVLNPMEQGIVENLKHFYRKRVMQKMITCYETKQTFNVDMKDVAFYLRTAWDSVTNCTIVDCFRQLNIGNAVEEIKEDVMDALEIDGTQENLLLDLVGKMGFEVPGELTMEQFVTADDYLLSSSELPSDGQVANSTKVTGPGDEHEESDDEANKMLEPVIPTRRQAVVYLEGLRSWVVANTDPRFCEATSRYFSKLDAKICNVPIAYPQQTRVPESLINKECVAIPIVVIPN